MLVSEMVLRVRETLRDPTSDRYTDTRILGALNLGILDMRRERPDLFIGRYEQPTYQVAALDEVFDLPEIMIPPLVKYATGWIEVADDEYASDGRAAALLKMSQADLGMG